MKYRLTLFFVLLTLFKANAQTAKDSAKQLLPYEWNFSQYRFGGYGEMLFQHMEYGPDRYKYSDGAPSDKRSYISVPRAVFAFDYKLRDDLVFGSEIEIEYGGAGSAMELEYEEAGEYETEIEKGGEIELEQFHLTKRFANWFNVRVGHMIVPIGITNSHHEPIHFFTTSRSEGETTLIPSTWHETGISILGYWKGFKYELMVVNGLDPNGFSSINWIQGGRQGMFETAVMTSPAVAGRMEWNQLKKLRLGFSGYYNRTAKNASKPEKTSSIAAPVTILSGDTQFEDANLQIRANYLWGNLGDSKRLSQINRNISSATGFARTPVAKNALTYSLEAGYNVASFFTQKAKLTPFVRYEYYNSAESVEEGMAEMPINKRNVWVVGLNYFMLPNLVLKADYSMRHIDNDNYNQENTFGLALAYTGWFSKK
jgi:hypothetical protein